MSPHQTIAVAVRVFAIWLAIGVLRTIPALFFLPDRVKSAVYLYNIDVFIVSVVVVVVLLCFPHTIAVKLLPPHAANPLPAASSDTWLAMGCALIGMWMLTYAVPALVRDTYIVLYNPSADDVPKIKTWILYNFLEVAIAAWLIFGARGFRKLFWWARDAGISKDL
jgi:hypothetical protein